MPFAKGTSGNPAGSKPRRVKFARPIAAAEKRISDKLPALIDNLFKLADGGFELGDDTLEPAGSITVGSGKNLSLAFPDLDPTALVIVRQTRSIAAPDRAANIYLVDRILGKPTEHHELTGADGGPIDVEDRGLSDEQRAQGIVAILDRVRARAVGPAGAAEADLGAAAGPTD